MNTACPDPSQLFDFVQRAVGAEERALLEAHIDRCAVCFGVVVQFARTGDDVAGASADPRPQPMAGDFVLLDAIGSGSLGRVWSAIHRDGELRAAIKILSGTHDESYLRAFRHEVRVIAGLDHPSIVQIYDHGELSRDAAKVVGNASAAGNPFFVMELASGGTLRASIAHPPAWGETEERLLALLGALAHAHANGLVHGDVKPSNVLICSSADRRPGVKLADFHLARFVSRGTVPGSSSSASGTPRYMAPEQITAAWRDVGPWTDLYAVGCIAFEMICGRQCFDGQSMEDVLRAHLTGRRAPFSPRCSVPLGVEEWIDRLIHPIATRRFECAGDAAEALRAHSRRAGSWRSPGSEQVLNASSDDPTVEVAAPEITTLVNDLDPAAVATPGSSPAAFDDWRACEHAVARVVPTLSLWGARVAPFVGRERERDALWHALVRVSREQRGEAMIVTGPVGSGKTRLVEWFCTLAHERALATVIRASHSEFPTVSEGIAASVAREIRCEDLSAADGLERIDRYLRLHGLGDRQLAVELARTIWPERAKGDDVRSSEPSLADESSALAAFLSALSRRRSLIVWIDDAPYGADSVQLVRDMVRAATSECPVLFVLTASDEALAERSRATDCLMELEASGCLARIALDALSDGDCARLLRMMLPLGGELASRVEERSGGIPLFALQLIGSWVERGVLNRGADGLELERGEGGDLPDGLHQLWSHRIERLLARRTDADGAALELAAVLGKTVRTTEWRAACDEQGLPADLALIEAMIERGLARAGERGVEESFCLIHELLRESLGRRARDAQRDASHHRACASVLERSTTPTDLERRARHLVGAGDLEPAAVALIEASRAHRVCGALAQAESLLDEHDRRASGLADDLRQRHAGESLLQRAHISARRGELAIASSRASEAEGVGEQHQWFHLVVRAQLLQAQLLLREESFGRASAYALAAQRRARELADPQLSARCRLVGASIELKQRQAAAADRAEDEGIDELYRVAVAEEREPTRMPSTPYAKYHAAWAHVYLAVCAARQERWEDFARMLARTKQLIAESDCADVDIAEMAEAAADVAAQASQSHAARCALEISSQQWRRLERDDRVAQVERRMSELAPG